MLWFFFIIIEVEKLLFVMCIISRALLSRIKMHHVPPHRLEAF
jgi:hypothetical protein